MCRWIRKAIRFLPPSHLRKSKKIVHTHLITAFYLLHDIIVFVFNDLFFTNCSFRQKLNNLIEITIDVVQKDVTGAKTES